jgi:hypothetical protein
MSAKSAACSHQCYSNKDMFQLHFHQITRLSPTLASITVSSHVCSKRLGTPDFSAPGHERKLLLMNSSKLASQKRITLALVGTVVYEPQLQSLQRQGHQVA